MERNQFNYWEELRKIIEGITPYTEDIRRLTADERRAARVAAAWDAAWNAAAKAKDWYKKHAIASALLWLEEKGLYGGGNRDPGAGTKRIRFFRCLGKGRRHAYDGPAWTEAIGQAAYKYGLLQWDLTNNGLGIRFEPYPEKALREFVIPLREIMFLDGVDDADAIEAWLTAASHAVKEFGKPRTHEVGKQIQDIFIAAVAEYTAAKEALSRAWELKAAKPQEAGEADSWNS
ncbi:MAG: hypothetical protein KatS3mg015_3029 [Fimbriimonadales bacterium]|nr:MAG: hypothetical protein KatS3mg015_3029 [Fimbriimonadales bacterium]